MLPDYALLVKCPYCGSIKKLMSLVSGNTFGAEYWSDNKQIAPMLPSTSPVQKCPNCGKYYMEYKQIKERGHEYSFDLGELSYSEWKEAYQQLVSQHEIKANNKYVDITDDDIQTINFFFIHAFNDHFHRKMETEPSNEEYAFFCKVVNDFIDGFYWPEDKVPLLKAEFYREANEMEKCAEVLNSINYDQLQNFEKEIYNAIKNRMEAGDTVVFKLSF